MRQRQTRNAHSAFKEPTLGDVISTIVIALMAGSLSQLLPLLFFDTWDIFWLTFTTTSIHSILDDLAWSRSGAILASLGAGIIVTITIT